VNILPDAPDRCPRCGGAFACGAARSAPCACTTVTLSAALQAQLRSQFQGCLCLACLHQLTQDGIAGDEVAPGTAADTRDCTDPIHRSPPQVGEL